MKKLLLISIFYFFTITCFSQIKSIPLNSKQNDFKILFKNDTVTLPFFLKNFPPITLQMKGENFREYKRMILPLDNMPCFVPNIKAISKIPTQKEIVYINNIPNSLKP